MWPKSKRLVTTKTAFSTTTTDTYPSYDGTHTTVTTTHSSVTTTNPNRQSSTTNFPVRTSSTTSPDFTIHWNPGAAGSLVIAVGGIFFVAGAVCTGDVPLALGTGEGDFDVWAYLFTTPSPNAGVALQKFAIPTALGIIGGILTPFIGPVFAPDFMDG